MSEEIEVGVHAPKVRAMCDELEDVIERHRNSMSYAEMIGILQLLVISYGREALGDE